MEPIRLPFYLKLTVILFMLGLIILLIILGQEILVPICFSILLAMLILPAVNYLQRKKCGGVISIAIPLLLSIIGISAVVYFLSNQIGDFLDDIPTIKKQLSEHYITLQKWVRTNFNVSIRDQNKFVTKATEKMGESGMALGQTFFSATKILFVAFLLPVYTFLILYYRVMIKNFLLHVFGKEYETKVYGVLQESKSIVQQYMVGLMIELAIVAAINMAGFFMIGIKYAIFLAVFAAILNMIPYIGMIIATVFCMAVTLTSSHFLADVLWVGGILVLVQFIDNNIIMPKVVSNKVKINALISIIGVLIGGTIAGVSGMFLSIPGIAILKAIFERVEGLEPWGMLLGDDITGTNQQSLRARWMQLWKKDPAAFTLEIPEDNAADNSSIAPPR
ncbi:AI-2E family transporter [Flavihumibacter fluvii]|uniref:AI-2E family transporter n=1 Tax=Flavihumibacter fluvii TaxID=2838157 RepID=UPI001BDF2E5B|nr:AI-2E family transporter [Flavihumibacter fluvii]ULQ53332.1 AI-2E family transporter [Flavihumibacter fluvii]